MTNCTKEPENDAVKTHNDAIDLISRADAIEAIRTLQTFKLFEGDDMILIDKSEVQTELMALPSADRTGEWIEEDEYGDLLVCSECGFANDYKDDYCPSCKARMKGDTTE